MKKLSINDIDAVMAKATSIRRPKPGASATRSVGEALKVSPTLSALKQSSWPQRIPLASSEAPPAFPIDMILPETARAFIQAVAVTYSVPVDLPAVAWLVLAGGCGTYRGISGVRVSPDWFEQMTLYGMVVLPSGTRKSSVFAALAEPVHAFEKEAREAAKPEVARLQAELEIKRKTLSKLQHAATDDPSVAAKAATLAEELACTPEPSLPRILTDDVTSEKLVQLLSNQNGKMILASPECDIIGTFRGRYADQAGANLGVFLKAHSGDAITVDRINRPSEHIARPALSMLVCGQPEAVGKMVGDTTLRDRGLVNRFLFASPTSPLGFRPTETPAIPETTRESYFRLMTGLLSAPVSPPVPPEWGKSQTSGGDGGGLALSREWNLTFAPEALDALRRFQSTVEESMRPDGDFHHQSGWASKLPGLVARIAAILTVAEDPARITVTGAEVNAAIAIGHWAMKHALVTFRSAGADPDVEIAKRILAWLERTGPKSFTRREVYQALKGKGSTVRQSKDLVMPLTILIDHGHILSADLLEQGDYARDRGGSALYIVHPDLAGQNK